MDRGLCVLEGLISMIEKGVLGSALTKKQRYWPMWGARGGDSWEHAKQGGWGCGCSASFNKREELSYYVYKGAHLCYVNDYNI